MNIQDLQRKVELLKLRLLVFFHWVPLKFEPKGSTVYSGMMADYRYAKRQLEKAQLRDREARLNRRVF